MIAKISQWNNSSARCRGCLVALLVAPAISAGAVRLSETSQATMKSESFDHDPGWCAQNNHIVPKKYPRIQQDFGFSQTKFAGKAAGEMGGHVTRASEPAFYADAIEPKTLDDKLSASGTFALTKTTSGGGVFFRVLQGGATGSGWPPGQLAGIEPRLRT